MKVVINRCFGGFGLSEEAIKYLNKTYNLTYHSFFEGRYYYLDKDLTRNDPRLIDCVEWEIDDYAGIETIHEKHRSWY